jgi:hypothetical protein
MPAQSDDLLIVERGGTLYKATAGEVAALGGGGGSPLGLADFWTENVFATTDVAQGPFLGAAIASGNNTGAIPAASRTAYSPYGVMLRGNNASVASGYRYQTSSLVADRFGAGSRKFEALLTWYEGYFVVGFFDWNSVAGADNPTDGAVFRYSPGPRQYSAVTFNDTVSSNAPFPEFTSGETYLFQIEVNADGTSAFFRIVRASTGAEYFTATITTNIPTATNRSFGAGLLAFNPSTGTQVDMMILHRMGFGTIAGYNRARG